MVSGNDLKYPGAGGGWDVLRWTETGVDGQRLWDSSRVTQ